MVGMIHQQMNKLDQAAALFEECRHLITTMGSCKSEGSNDYDVPSSLLIILTIAIADNMYLQCRYFEADDHYQSVLRSYSDSTYPVRDSTVKFSGWISRQELMCKRAITLLSISSMSMADGISDRAIAAALASDRVSEGDESEKSGESSKGPALAFCFYSRASVLYHLRDITAALDTCEKALVLLTGDRGSGRDRDRSRGISVTLPRSPLAASCYVLRGTVYDLFKDLTWIMKLFALTMTVTATATVTVTISFLNCCSDMSVTVTTTVTVSKLPQLIQ